MIKFFSRPTDAAEAEFAEWLRQILKHPENAERHVDLLFEQQDWSASLTVEVSSFLSRSRRPETYRFHDSDMMVETTE